MAGFMLKGGAGGTHWARPARRVPSEQGVRDVHMLPLHAAEPGAEQGVALRVVAAVDRATILTSAGEVGGGGGGHRPPRQSSKARIDAKIFIRICSVDGSSHVLCS